ncbi:MAG: hypothetical protein QNJ91_07635 [Gammaproteobacteria bacterium]|nr:hypothetical protein [Gammaproteobacteria bacterium]
MPHTRYVMRDLNGAKVDHIMEFNVASGRPQPRSWVDLAVFVAVVLVYVGALALTA